MTQEESPAAEWGPDDTVALSLTIPKTNLKRTGKFGLEFGDEVDFSTIPKATPVFPDEGVLFVVSPTLTWNALQAKLKDLGVSFHDLSIMSCGRAYRIPTENMFFKEFEAGIRVILKMTIRLEKFDGTHDFIDTVRFGQPPLDPDTYPFVIFTRGCWNNFQTHTDRLQIREELRSCKPIGFKVKNEDCFRISNQKFSELKMEFEKK